MRLGEGPLQRHGLLGRQQQQQDGQGVCSAWASVHGPLHMCVGMERALPRHSDTRHLQQRSACHSKACGTSRFVGWWLAKQCTAQTPRVAVGKAVHCADTQGVAAVNTCCTGADQSTCRTSEVATGLSAVRADRCSAPFPAHGVGAPNTGPGRTVPKGLLCPAAPGSALCPGAVPFDAAGCVAVSESRTEDASGE
jgi:hypothetical protein